MDESSEKNGKIISFPDGKSVELAEIGSDDYVIKQAGDSSNTSEVLDPIDIDKDLNDRTKYVINQELVKFTKQGSPIRQTVDVLLVEIAEELSHLKFERRKAAKEGKNTFNYTLGRINSLKSLAELLLKRKDSEKSGELDLKSSKFQLVFKIWMEFLYESMEKVGVDSKEIDLVFQQMKADMVDMEKRLANEVT